MHVVLDVAIAWPGLTLDSKRTIITETRNALCSRIFYKQLTKKRNVSNTKYHLLEIFVLYSEQATVS